MQSGDRKKAKFSWGTLLRVVVTVGILLFFALTVDLGKLWQQFESADLRWIATAFGVFGVVMVLIARRWWNLLKVQAIMIPFKAAAAMTLIGQFFNTFLPGSIGGDLVKIFYIIKYTPNRKAKAALSILMDRFLGILVLLTVAVATLPFQIKYFPAHPELKVIMFSLTGLLLAVIVSIVAMAVMPFHRFPNKWKAFWEKLPKHEVVESLVDGFRQHGRSLKFTLMALGWCICVHLTGFAAGYCLAKGLHLEVSYFQMIVILAMVYILMSLPISISGHGVREFGAVLMFTIYGVITIDPVTQIGKEPALAFGLLIFGLNLFWGLAGGWVYLMYHHEEKKTAREI